MKHVGDTGLQAYAKTQLRFAKTYFRTRATDPSSVCTVTAQARQPLFQIRKDGTYNMLQEQWFDEVAAAGDVG